ncbi:sulfatase-like hydrolase/transferase [Natranaerofaba carboxydovora]|uniref:sulfatase-like hydrolase/transferase n=1 Tax=Natranaerofaba carboxydovora TaxID=2742683 RepID=UPI001F138EBE|nr:sulfatase-like hydrolase/transferase [Natranaerofaba carboxydovora]UMZ74127.1 Sulfatase [Natranaerofaba carboxydovora]
MKTNVKTYIEKLRSNWKDILVSFSLANLFFLRVWHELIFADPEGQFYFRTLDQVSIAALLLNVFLLGAVILSLFILFQKNKNNILQKILAFVLFVSLIFPLNALRLLATEISITDIVEFLGRAGFGVLIFLIAVSVVYLSFKLPDRIINAVSIIYIIFSPFLILSFGQGLWAFATTDSFAQESVSEMSKELAQEADEEASKRVVWFIFDELDQRLTFEEERPDDLEINELDNLKNDGFYATNAHAPEDETILSMPAFTIGEKVKNADPKGPAELKLTSKETEETFNWSERKNIFDEISVRGGNSALSGIYLPYCRIIGDSPDICSWHPFGTIEHNKEYNLTEAMFNQLLAPFAISPFNQRRHAINVHKSVYDDAKELVTNPNLDLVLIHWSVPHFPWIYDREMADFSVFNYDLNKGYYDNLALVDQTIKDMRLAMESDGTWDDTYFIVSSDHPWRMHLFPTYDEKFDPRIPFIIRTPAENEKVTHTEDFNTVQTYDIILSILDGELNSAEEISNWLK